jgi:hypothetical protein
VALHDFGSHAVRLVSIPGIPLRFATGLSRNACGGFFHCAITQDIEVMPDSEAVSHKHGSRFVFGSLI